MFESTCSKLGKLCIYSCFSQRHYSELNFLNPHSLSRNGFFERFFGAAAYAELIVNLRLQFTLLYSKSRYWTSLTFLLTSFPALLFIEMVD